MQAGHIPPGPHQPSSPYADASAQMDTGLPEPPQDTSLLPSQAPLAPAVTISKPGCHIPEASEPHKEEEATPAPSQTSQKGGLLLDHFLGALNTPKQGLW